MAMSKELLEEQAKIEDHDTDLTLCGICEAPIEDPKALPCLHTFCLGCIKEWAGAKTDKITCPLCKEDFVIPPEGVAGFRSNFFVTKLKKTQSIKEEMVERKITSTCCENAGSAMARCLDCKDYLCETCVQAHKTVKHFKSHRVYSFDDIRSGKVDVHKLHVQEYCTKHKGQVLWFFCESCGILICRDCTVVDHPASTHTLVNVEEVSGAQAEKMEELASLCQKVAEEVADAIKIAGDVENDLEKALQKAKQKVEQAMSEIIEHLKVQQQKCEDRIAQVGEDCRAKIAAGNSKLQSQQSQLRRALDMADTVTNRGSPYDLAAIYTTLTDTMQKLTDIKPLSVPSELAEVKFVLNKDLTILPEFGTLTTPVDTKLDLKGEWKMTSLLCEQNSFNNAVGFAFYNSGDFAVVCTNTDDQVKVFKQDGTFKYDINVKQDSKKSEPFGIAISSNNVYVTDRTPCVKVFDSNAKLTDKFQSVSPAASQCSEESSLFGLSIDHDDQIIVGDYSNSYISIHTLCGTHLSSFITNIKPVFIATAPFHKTMVVSQRIASKAQIMDYTGQVLYTLDNPTGVNIAWELTGMCYNGDKEFLIASQARTEPDKKAGIHHYTTDGDYLGCITTEVTQPTNVAITSDGKILVLEWTSVKVFTKK